jgi:hypothetical protein
VQGFGESSVELLLPFVSLSATIPLELFDFPEAQDNFTWIKASYVPLRPAIEAAQYGDFLAGEAILEELQ